MPGVQRVGHRMRRPVPGARTGSPLYELASQCLQDPDLFRGLAALGDDRQALLVGMREEYCELVAAKPRHQVGFT